MSRWIQVMGFKKRVLIAFVFLILISVCSIFPLASARHAFNMRALDWEKLVENDPALEHPYPRDQDFTGWQNYEGPFVSTKAGDPENQVAGNAKNRDVFFVDLAGDGQEEAIILLNPGGGSGGYQGVLIYGVKNGVPVLIDALPGSHVDAYAEGNLLVFRQALWDALDLGPSNCCPDGFEQTYYRLNQEHLTKEKYSRHFDPGMRFLMVLYYYDMLEIKHYEAAYNYLSPAFQAANPYSQWLNQYKDTVSINGTSHDTVSEFKTSELPDGSIGVDFMQTDYTAASEK